MMFITGCIIVLATLVLLVKHYEARMVLICSGILMCIIGGVAMSGLDAFAKGMKSGMITSACSSMGFALAMRFTGCDKHLINGLAKILLKVNWLLIPGVIFGTYAVNMALPSAAGTAAAAGAIFIPILMGAGVHPAMAAAAVKCGTYGSMLNPGLAHNPFVAQIAGVDVMDVIAFHYRANIASLVVGAVA
ncbi:MAG: C4-dicarboxylate transporter DcuC, partial [Schwartzia sp.]|nr:C4-dicarboxylate transporter DcuC [Schwartzia sp. (in: firmicutes)]